MQKRVEVLINLCLFVVLVNMHKYKNFNSSNIFIIFLLKPIDNYVNWWYNYIRNKESDKGEIKMKIKKTNELINKIMEIVKLNDGYEYIGLRTVDTDCDTFDYEVGKWMPDSYNWDHDLDVSTYETTGETLDGTCATEINKRHMFLDGSDDDKLRAAVERALKIHTYIGDLTMIIAGDSASGGEDPDEIIIRDATLIAILNK